MLKKAGSYCRKRLMVSRDEILLILVAFFAIILLKCESSTLRSSTKSEAMEALPWWQKTVVYQIYPQSFMDSNGDGIGDLKGIIKKLYYFTELKVETIWLNPIFASPMKAFGYDISNYEAIAPLFGTMEDFKKLLKEAHKRGIKVILDFVPNHSSNQHIWFEKSRNRIDPYTDYYVWRNGTGLNGTDPPNNWISNAKYSAWKYDEVRKQFYYHQFIADMPDLNYRSKELRREMKKVIRFWLDKGVDGFRVDAAKYLIEDDRFLDEPLSHDPNAKPEDPNYLRHIYTENTPETLSLIREWKEILDSYEEKDNFHRLFMLEVYDPLETVAMYFGNSTATFCDFPFNFEIVTNLNKTTSGHDLHNIVNNWLRNLPKRRWSNWVLGNHDQHRIGTKSHVELIDGLNMVSLLLPGTAVTYYGEEIGMVDGPTKWEAVKPRLANNAGKENFPPVVTDPQRNPMQWDSTRNAGFSTAERTWHPINPNYTIVNVETEFAALRSHLKVYKKLVSLRKKQTLQLGSLEFPLITDGLFSFVRLLKDNPAYMVVVNMSNKKQKANFSSAKTTGYHFPKEAKVVVGSINIPDISTAVKNARVSLTELVLSPYEALVLQFNPIYSENRKDK